MMVYQREFLIMFGAKEKVTCVALSWMLGLIGTGTGSDLTPT